MVPVKLTACINSYHEGWQRWQRQLICWSVHSGGCNHHYDILRNPTTCWNNADIWHSRHFLWPSQVHARCSAEESELAMVWLADRRYYLGSVMVFRIYYDCNEAFIYWLWAQKIVTMCIIVKPISRTNFGVYSDLLGKHKIALSVPESRKRKPRYGNIFQGNPRCRYWAVIVSVIWALKWLFFVNTFRFRDNLGSCKIGRKEPDIFRKKQHQALLSAGIDSTQCDQTMIQRYLYTS